MSRPSLPVDKQRTITVRFRVTADEMTLLRAAAVMDRDAWAEVMGLRGTGALSLSVDQWARAITLREAQRRLGERATA